MKTKVVRIDENNIDMKVIEEAGRILKGAAWWRFPRRPCTDLEGTP